MLQEFAGRKIRAFIVWEPVLPTDWGAPSTSALNRIADTRTAQFWDKDRLISHLLGEHDSGSIVWDHIAVYQPGVMWRQQPPPAAFADGTVVRKLDLARMAIAQALSERREKVTLN